MNLLRNIYRDFFGLNEQVTGSVKLNPKDPNSKKDAAELAKQGINVELTEDDIEEAKLINGIRDYRGGVVYTIYDPAQAREVSDDIRTWAEKKGFTVVTQSISKSGRVGYFYFRLGADPEKESQRIQGYFSSKLELKSFKFKVRNAETTPTQNLPAKI